MRQLSVVFSVLLLGAAAAPAARPARVELSARALGEATTVPVNFGDQPLGDILELLVTLCFREDTSPPGTCDGAGKVQLSETLTKPFFLAGQFRVDVATGKTTSVNFPVNLRAGEQLLFVTHWIPSDLGAAADDLILRVTPSGSPREDVTLALMGHAVTPGTCLQDFDTLCLNNDRFKVKTAFLTSDGRAGNGDGLSLTGDTGYFFFFDPGNVEAVVKVLNGCSSSLGNRYWVFAGGLTDVRTVITVTDTQRNAVKTYINPQGTAFQPIQDTSAFATCP